MNPEIAAEKHKTNLLSRLLHLDTFLRTGLQSGFPYVLLSMLSVQGAAFITQLLASHAVTPSEFGVIRSLEATIGVLTLAASLGMPSLAIKLAAELNGEQRGALLQRLLAVGFGASALIAASLTLLAVLLPSESYSRLAVYGWIVGATNAARIGVNYFLGIKQVKSISLVTSLIAISTIGMVTTCVVYAGVPGWILGRYLGEGILLAAVLYTLRSALGARTRLPSHYSHLSLVSMGIPIGLGLFTRSAIDNGPIIALNIAGMGKAEIGDFGLATLLIVPVLLLPSVATSMSIPYFVQRLPQPLEYLRMFRKAVIAALISSLALALIALVGFKLLIDVFAPQYRASQGILLVLLLVAPFRALATLCGTVLLTLDANYSALYINICEAVLLVLVLFVLVPQHGSFGAAWATTLIGFLSAAAFYSIATWHVQRIQRMPRERTA